MAFQTSLSGLSAAQSNLSVTGNNIANASTNGFKKSRAEFADIYANSFGGSGSTSIGAGVRLSNVSQQFTQGNVEFTENGLDLAVSGEGFFTLRDTDGSMLYTRAGAFGVDREGFVVNTHGQRLQAYDTDPITGVVSNFTARDLQLDTGTNPARATDDPAGFGVQINMNLDAAVPVTGASSFSTSTTIYDSLGEEHVATMTFTRTGTFDPTVAGTANSWDVMMDIAGTTSGPIPIVFDSAGQLSSVGGVAVPLGATTAPATFFTTPYNTGTGSDPIDNLAVDFIGSTMYAGESAVNSLVQSGYSTGRLSGIDIDGRGVVFARYTNGQSDLLGAVAMTQFANKQGLQQVGDTNWAQTFDSGDAVTGQAGSGTFGVIQSGALESSNVDLSQQLVNMIVAQRDFQANAKMISTEDTITQTIINIR